MDTPRYSVTPPWSFATFVTPPAPVYRSPGFPEAFSVVVRWLFGRAPRSSARDRFLEGRAVDLLVAELEAEPDTADKSAPVEKTISKTKGHKQASADKSAPAQAKLNERQPA